MNDADAYIEENPYAAETISQKAAHAEFMARRMMTISESSKKFKEMSPEAAAIYVESLFARLGETMNTGDLRDKDVEAQLNSLTGTVETMGQKTQSLEKDNQDYQAQLATLEQQISSLKGYSREQEEAKQKLSPNANSMSNLIRCSAISGLTKQKSTNRAANWSFACEAFSFRRDRPP